MNNLYLSDTVNCVYIFKGVHIFLYSYTLDWVDLCASIWPVLVIKKKKETNT